MDVGASRFAAKLSATIAQEIRLDHARGQSIRSLARRHGVSVTAIQRILRREVYRHDSLPPPAQTEATE